MGGGLGGIGGGFISGGSPPDQLMRCLPRFWPHIATAGFRCGISPDGVDGLLGGPICICSVATSPFPSEVRIGAETLFTGTVVSAASIVRPCAAGIDGGPHCGMTRARFAVVGVSEEQRGASSAATVVVRTEAVATVWVGESSLVRFAEVLVCVSSSATGALPGMFASDRDTGWSSLISVCTSLCVMSGI